MTVYRNLMKEIEKPYYQGTPQISIPKKIGRKQLERLKNIAAQIRKVGKKVKELQREGYEVWGAVTLPKTLTQQTVKKVRQESNKIKRTARRDFNVIDEEDFNYFKDIVGRIPIFTPLGDRNEFKTHSELDEWRDLKRILRRNPTKEEYEAYIGETPAPEEYEVDFETGEIIKKGTKQGEFYRGNEYGAEYGNSELPTQTDISINRIQELLNILEQFDISEVQTQSPMSIGTKYDLVQSLKTEIEEYLEKGNKDRIIENLEANWNEIADRLDNIMYRTYSQISGDVTPYNPAPDYERLMEIIKG